MVRAFFWGHGKGRMHMCVYLQPAEFSMNAFFFNVKNFEANGEKCCVHQIQFCFDKNRDFYSTLSWFLKMHFYTRGACFCMLCCGRIVKPLFYQLYEVETVGLWVWIPFMTCVGWWASTTGPPRVPPSQGCEHLSVMPLFQKYNVPKKSQKYLEELGNSL